MQPVKPSRDVWLHVHVPKAGGSTFRQLMNRNFGDGYYNSNSLLETKQYNREDVSEIIRCHPWLRCFSDHKLSLDLPFDSEHANVHAICFVREPLERFISRFYFHRNFEEVNCIAQQMSFRDFANMELVEKFVHPQTNSQTFFLNGGIDGNSLAPVEAGIELGKTLLFPIERFDEACVYLEREFGDTFSDLSYVRVNTSKRDDKIETEDREFAFELLQSDLPLLKLAHQQLDACLSKTFENKNLIQESVELFRDRCSRRYHNFRPPRGKDEPLPTENEIATDKSTNRPTHVNINNSND